MRVFIQSKRMSTRFLVLTYMHLPSPVRLDVCRADAIHSAFFIGRGKAALNYFDVDLKQEKGIRKAPAW